MGAPRRRRSRFINAQRHRRSCAPIAIANTIKWHEVETSYRSILDFCDKIGSYIQGFGMRALDLGTTLKILRVKYKLRRKFTHEDVEKWLKQGRALIFVYPRPTGVSHAVFVDQIEPGGFRTWNVGAKSKPFMSTSELRESIKLAHSRGQYCYAYVFQPLRA